MKLAAILMLIAVSSAANAITPLDTRNKHETITLDYFMEACTVIGETGSGLISHFDCDSYLYGIMDTQRVLNASLPPAQRACIPEQLAPWQLYEQIGSAIPDNEWSKLAAPPITRLLRQKYPCGTPTVAETPNGSCKAANAEPEMYECLNAELKKSDAELNTAYQSLLSRYEKNSAQSRSTAETQDIHLKHAQRAWIKMRDASCDFETYESKTGSGFGAIHTACLLKQTQDRVEYLNGFIQRP
ncbi:Uncharacterized conserved protein YecT, DUF1311 family [Pseudomonas flavescens]|uniref:Uncharacterized conserved protein YecT, DUF1311 family n=1 Tax=Phytopseudomonas flavescens TaxID=29435 RepID=A0A1G8BF10_9GAMM|nr:lysozyme inhibitor LprI family protein [Pseudomonas flavescens]SDH31170.1 Uncharacterized conserved protein YecT, DUF1311 family [Pseudomonas flavescens]